MTANDTCSYCGAEKVTSRNTCGDVLYGCGAVQFAGRDTPNRTSLCMQRQIEQLTEKIKQAAERARREAFDECEKICFDVWKNSYAEETAPVGQIAQHFMYLIRKKGEVK